MQQHASTSFPSLHACTPSQERCEECDGDEKRLVVRDGSRWGSLEQLPASFRTRVADRIYTSMSMGFRVGAHCAAMCRITCCRQGQQFGAPLAVKNASTGDLCEGVQRIVDVFVERGFALKAEVVDRVVDAQQGGSFAVRVEGPANLWGRWRWLLVTATLCHTGIGALVARRSLVINTYVDYAIDGYLRACGRTPAYRSTRTDVGTTSYFTL